MGISLNWLENNNSFLGKVSISIVISFRIQSIGSEREKKSFKMHKMDKSVKPNLVPLNDLLNATDSIKNFDRGDENSNLRSASMSSNSSRTERYRYKANSNSTPIIGQYLKVVNDVISPVSQRGVISEKSSPSSLDSPSSYVASDHKKSFHVSYDSNNSDPASPTSSQFERKSEDEISNSIPTDEEVLNLVCKWGNCDKIYHQPELLYHHLCQDHVGRKSQRNLHLNCNWENCQTKTEKRDHITSHIRVHIPFKPFGCSSCRKNFKRPQDLKKHLKIHLDSGNLLKRKRGPKVGSKKVNKNSIRTKDIISNDFKEPLEEKLNANQNERSLSLGMTATNLPNIKNGFQRFVTNDIQRYEPVYTHQLGSKLQSVLTHSSSTISNKAPPQMSSRTTSTVSSPSSIIDGLPVHVTTNAAMFFSDLSQNMSSTYPTFQNRSIPTFHPRLDKYPQIPPLKGSSVPTILESSNRMVNNRHPTLPSMAEMSTMTARYDSSRNSSWGQVNYNYPVITSNLPNNSSESRSVTGIPHSLPNSLTTNQLYATGSTLNMVENRYSTAQKNNGKSSDEIYNSEVSEEEFENTLESVNIIRDYLMCTLLEDEYNDDDDDDDDEDDDDDSDNIANIKTDFPEEERILIWKYPTIAI